MLRGARVAAVVPALNEARLIGRVVRSVPGFVDVIVVVDDGSTDATCEAASSAGDARLVVVRHERNCGVGAAIRTGYRAALELGADVVAVMAGDAQMDPADLEALVDVVVGGEAEYAKGDRLSYPGVRARMPLSRWLGNHVLSWLTRRVTGIAMCDSQCGYTAIGRRALTSIGFEQMWPRYGYPNDLLGLLAIGGHRVRDVTVRPIYGDEESGIGLRHALFVVPFVLMRVAVRRLRVSLGAAPALEAAR